MEKTFFYQVFEWANSLKSSNKKTVKVQDIYDRLEQLVKDKLTVELQIDKEPVKFEGLTQTQSDVLSLIFKSYVKDFEQRQLEASNLNHNGFELVGEWNESTVKTEEPKDAKKKKNPSKFRGKMPVATPSIKK